MLAKLIFKADELKIALVVNEVYRPAETARYYASIGSGIPNSLHCLKLAVDISLFKDGRYLTKSADYRELGEWWEAQATDKIKTHWGGRFNDPFHFSVGHGGIK